MRKGILVIIAPLEGSPAETAGMRAGDKIIKIDDTSAAELTLDEAVHLIRGPKGTSVTLTILSKRGEDTKEIKVMRDTIRIPTLSTRDLGQGIFLIKLFNFNEGSVQAFRQAVREFLLSGSKKIILDLRNNPGGFLEASVDIASWFLPEGTVVAREVFADGQEQLYRSRGYGALETVSLVIVINQGSASASEIVAGALREHKNVPLIGEKTFGKGSVQQVESITPETSLKVTIARWLTPNGFSLSKEGLTPDIEVVSNGEEDAQGEQKEKELKSFFAVEEDDRALARAIEYLAERE
jgi:carboxyl-terminal processing protease